MKNYKIPLPDTYVFKEKYDCCFLLSDTEAMLSYPTPFFKFKNFVTKIGGETLFLKLIDIETHAKVKHIVKVPITKNITSEYLEHYCIEGHTLESILDEYWVYDDAKNWEMYVYLPDEIAILGCRNIVAKSLIKTIKPYHEDSLQDKFKHIIAMFGSAYSLASKYIKKLDHTYKFQR